mmetsp:Transcript_99282/g.266694  ORF Transcript_99282/g.266694 Transcript_99282/m.266694 type:complete len:376 (+) Transcript_99282:146-1273(+)
MGRAGKASSSSSLSSTGNSPENLAEYPERRSSSLTCGSTSTMRPSNVLASTAICLTTPATRLAPVIFPPKSPTCASQGGSTGQPEVFVSSSSTVSKLLSQMLLRTSGSSRDACLKPPSSMSPLRPFWCSSFSSYSWMVASSPRTFSTNSATFSPNSTSAVEPPSFFKKQSNSNPIFKHIASIFWQHPAYFFVCRETPPKAGDSTSRHPPASKVSGFITETDSASAKESDFITIPLTVGTAESPRRASKSTIATSFCTPLKTKASPREVGTSSLRTPTSSTEMSGKLTAQSETSAQGVLPRTSGRSARQPLTVGEVAAAATLPEVSRIECLAALAREWVLTSSFKVVWSINPSRNAEREATRAKCEAEPFASSRSA